MKKISGVSMDIVADNIEKLKGIFPEVFCEDKIDFERLQEVLGNYIEDKEERYRFEWNGKSKAIRISQTPSTGTLRPCNKDSKDWDTTQNLYIEGDNLEVLKLLQKSYQNKIKMIYIDPPYNTGNDFVYKDDFKDNIWNYLAITGQLDDEGKKISTNSEASGRYHTDWLNMIYPRLRLAKNLLKNDGAIFISIDDNEVFNLKKICDEIYGEYNFIGCITREAIKGGSISKNIRIVTDYILVYAKNIDLTDFSGIEVDGIQLNLEDEKGKYAKGRELNKWGAGSRREDAPGMWFPIKGPNGVDVYPIRNDGSEGRWRLGREKLNKLVENGDVIFEKRDNGTYIVYEKIRDDSPRIKQYTNLFKDEYINSKGSEELKRIFAKDRAIFDYSKPSNLLIDLLRMCNVKDNDIVLDFFSGSATTATAIMQFNKEKYINVKYIMVQLPEKTDVTSEAFKQGYKNICDIGKGRINKVGDSIIEEINALEQKNYIDIGFKTFKLDSSNIKKWNPDYDNLEQSFDDILENFVPNRTEEDIVYEIMLKYGIDLTYPVEERVINGKKVFNIGFGALIICLDDKINLDVINGIVELKEELEPEICRVVFKDNGFANDSVKTNAIQILKRNNIKEVMSI
ncbi:site-specific DNA-methyltransferase [Clostridium tertium]|uniref:site-specific DNA-methyltransferase n=1 Tax=Clostridium tertium TaxID=1559 RepID=UPI000BE29183|nr:site-specific DNA-methyltransferase [Clostridium tertium]